MTIEKFEKIKPTLKVGTRLKVKRSKGKDSCFSKYDEGAIFIVTVIDSHDITIKPLYKDIAIDRDYVWIDTDYDLYSHFINNFELVEIEFPNV